LMVFAVPLDYRVASVTPPSNYFLGPIMNYLNGNTSKLLLGLLIKRGRAHLASCGLVQ
jgi:hypothetical protein